METIGDYVRRGGEHFIPLDNLPVVTPDTNVSDTLGIMRHRGTAGVLVREGEQCYRLLLHQHLSGLDLPRLRSNPAETPLTAVLNVASVLTTIDASRSRDDARTVVSGDCPFRSVMVVMDSRVIGLLTEAEDWGHAFFTPAPVYRCEQRHYFAPPPPATCPVDGSPVS